MAMRPKYASADLQEAENQRLYLHGDALQEISSQGEGFSDDTQRAIHCLTAKSHAEACYALFSGGFYPGQPSAPRLIMDLIDRGFLTYEDISARGITQRRVEFAHTHNNRLASQIVEECRNGNFTSLPILMSLLAYQVRLDDPSFCGCFEEGQHPTQEEIQDFQRQVTLQQCETLLLAWRESQKEMKWMQLFQLMVMKDISPTELPMTRDEREAFAHRKIPQYGA